MCNIVNSSFPLFFPIWSPANSYYHMTVAIRAGWILAYASSVIFEANQLHLVKLLIIVLYKAAFWNKAPSTFFCIHRLKDTQDWIVLLCLTEREQCHHSLDSMANF